MPNDSINLTLIGANLEHLDGLCRAKRAAADEFRDACKAIGQEARVEASVLAKFVNARVAETSDKASHDADQLSLLFTEVGL
jgi:predicted HicB family RNase H-like nuclease